MTDITAAVCHAFGEPLRVETVSLRAPGPGEVEVELGAVAICHSDIAYASGIWGGSLPAVYGHEAAGTVAAVGPGVTACKPGDRVVVTLIRACGECPSCASGHPTGCDVPYDGDLGPLTTAEGGKLHQAMACGAFAERVVVDKSQIAVVPDTVPMEVAALLACGVITGVGAVVNTAGLRPGQDVVVIGAGGVGLNAIQGARLSGARRIVAVDLLPAKLEVAKEFGATHGVVASGDAPWDEAREILGKGAEAVFVTVGAIAAFDSALKYVTHGGRVVVVGMPPVGAKSTYEPVDITYHAQQISGSNMGDSVIRRDIPWLVDLYLQGRLKLDELISRRWSLSEINEAIADTKTGAARRNVIVF